eukprot:365090-Chlamydomonas_euryale.AAC.6
MHASLGGLLPSETIFSHHVVYQAAHNKSGCWRDVFAAARHKQRGNSPLRVRCGAVWMASPRVQARHRATRCGFPRFYGSPHTLSMSPLLDSNRGALTVHARHIDADNL